MLVVHRSLLSSPFLESLASLGPPQLQDVVGVARATSELRLATKPKVV